MTDPKVTQENWLDLAEQLCIEPWHDVPPHPKEQDEPNLPHLPDGFKFITIYTKAGNSNELDD